MLANTLARMVDIIFQVDGLYARPANFAGRVGFIIAGGKVSKLFIRCVLTLRVPSLSHLS